MTFKLTTWRKTDGFWGVAMTEEGHASISVGPRATRVEAREALMDEVKQVDGFRIVKRLRKGRFVPSLGKGGHPIR